MRIPGTTFSDDGPSGPPAEISFDDFQKVDLRAGKVIAADRVPESKKLIRMDVDFGRFKRQIVGGIGKHWAPEGDEPGSLVGKTFLFVVNLAPRKFVVGSNAYESHGMILASPFKEDGTESMPLLMPTTPTPPGSSFG